MFPHEKRMRCRLRRASSTTRAKGDAAGERRCGVPEDPKGPAGLVSVNPSSGHCLGNVPGGVGCRSVRPAIRYRRAGVRFSRFREIRTQQVAIVAANASPRKSKGFSYGFTLSIGTDDAVARDQQAGSAQQRQPSRANKPGRLPGPSQPANRPAQPAKPVRPTDLPPTPTRRRSPSRGWPAGRSRSARPR